MGELELPAVASGEEGMLRVPLLSTYDDRRWNRFWDLCSLFLAGERRHGWGFWETKKWWFERPGGGGVGGVGGTTVCGSRQDVRLSASIRDGEEWVLIKLRSQEEAAQWSRPLANSSLWQVEKENPEPLGHTNRIGSGYRLQLHQTAAPRPHF